MAEDLEDFDGSEPGPEMDAESPEVTAGDMSVDEEAATLAGTAGAANTKTAAGRGRGGGRGGGAGAGRQASKSGRAKGNTKWCGPCGKYLPICDFPPGKSVCSKDNNALRSLASAAKAQDQQDWWNKINAEPPVMKQVLAAYHNRCHVEGKRNKRGFPIATYREELRRASAMLRDGVYEMMNERAAIEHFGKAKNGGFDADDAKQKFEQEFRRPGAISDLLGPTPRLARRVAIKVKDVITIRESEERVRSLDLKEKEVKDADQNKIDELEDRLQRGSSWSGGAASSAWEAADRMNKGFAASEADGQIGIGAFTGAGAAAAMVGDIRDLADEAVAHKAPKADVAQGAGPSAGGNTGTSDGGDQVSGDGQVASPKGKGGAAPAAPASTPGKKKAKPWYSRDEDVLDQLSTFNEWLLTTKGGLRRSRSVLQSLFLEVSPKIEPIVRQEMKLLQNRLQAVKLVLAEETESTVAHDQGSLSATSVKQEEQTDEGLHEPSLPNASEKPIATDPPPSELRPGERVVLHIVDASSRVEGQRDSAAEAGAAKGAQHEGEAAAPEKDSVVEGDDAAIKSEAASVAAGAAGGDSGANNPEAASAAAGAAGGDGGAQDSVAAGGATFGGDGGAKAEVDGPPSEVLAGLRGLRGAGTGIQGARGSARGSNSDDDLSTVHKFVLSCGGPVKALKRYIASFGEGKPELGTTPPCRTYRHLKVQRKHKRLTHVSIHVSYMFSVVTNIEK